MTRIVKGNPPAMADEGLRFPLLVSYAYLRKANASQLSYILNEAKADGFDVLLDCGAFSAANAGHEITLDEYMSFLHAHKDSFFKYIALDKLGDPKITEENLQTMFREGLDPCPVHVWGDDQKRMDELFERSDLVFLGGLRRPGRGAAPKEYLAKKMQWANRRNVHWLGYTSQRMVRTFQPYSCDCSSWGSAQRYGQCGVYMGNGRWWTANRKDRREKLPLQVLSVIQKLGYSESDWRLDVNWRMEKALFMSMDITTASWIRYIMEMRRDHGSRIFLACAMSPFDLDAIVKHWRFLRDEWSAS